LTKEYDNIEIYWAVFGASEQRANEATKSANLFLGDVKQKNIAINNFRDGYFPYIGIEIKEYFENLKRKFSPDLIFTHYRHDLHQDHRLISELTWNTFRNHLILEYEIIKYDGDLGNPNFFVDLGGEICQRKLKYIRDCYESQSSHNWFSDDTFLSILRLRGLESNAAEKYAEAFYCRKISF
jgi:LmbE family N-acetylglucosaminyl deacetylase